MNAEQISALAAEQRAFFNSGATKDVSVRIERLLKLKNSIKKHEPQLCAALKTDLNKSEFEAYATEIGIVLEEITHTVKHLRGWAKPKRVKTPLAHFPSTSRIYPEPFGVVLVMAPWNYPVQLALAPLIGAIAAGNCVILKPSNYSPTVSACLAAIIADCFKSEYCAVVLGGRSENQSLLGQKFDFIFFTGGTEVGRTVMLAAAQHLTPVVLELGGKSPCIVGKSANIALAARRIAWGKFINAGQTCVAPDYACVHESVAALFIEEIKKSVAQFFGEKPLENPDYCKIIAPKHFERISALITAKDTTGAQPRIEHGGGKSETTGKIEPTVLSGVNWDSPVMQEEIFGPVLPVLTFQSLDELVKTLKNKPKPLALYHFTRDRAEERLVLRELSHGGGCVNDTVVHLATTQMPFGGVGNSGMGGYHGKFSFETFSHKKSILKKANWLDLPMRYAPYREFYLKIVKLIMK